MARVFDLKSGVTRLVVDAGMEIYDLRIVGTTITIAGNRKIVTWNLPAGDGISNDRVDIGNSIQTITFNQPQKFYRLYKASISPNLKHIVVSVCDKPIVGYDLYIFEMPTGKFVGLDRIMGTRWWVTPGGSQVKELFDHRVHTYSITKDDESDINKDFGLWEPTGGCPWQSFHGHQVMDNGWIVSSTGKWLLWLPPHLQLDEEYRVWGGQHLAFLYNMFPEAFILEVLEK